MKVVGNDELEQTIALGQEIEGGEEAKEKVEFYTEVLENTQNHLDALNELIENQKKVINDTPETRYQIAKWKEEKFDLLLSLQTKKNYFEMWLQRANQYKAIEASITADANGNFDIVLKRAKEICMENADFVKALNQFEDNNEYSNQQKKNEFFLYMKATVLQTEQKKK